MNIYRVKMNDEEFFKCSDKIVACNISVSNGQVCFKTDKITIKYLNEKSLKYELVSSKTGDLRRNLFINKGIIFGVLLFAFALLMNSYRVSEIVYNASYVINDDVKSEVTKDIKRLFFWDFYGGNLDQCALNLRRKYVNYQWISLEKKGSKIMVTINDYDDSSIDVESETIGDVVASKAGIIKYYTIYRGGNNVEVNKYVQKGDVLISSDQLINKGSPNQSLVSARGLVLANTYETFTKTINKEDKQTILSGKVNNYTTLNLFGLKINIGKKASYQESDIIETEVFNFFNIITVKKIEEQEKCDIIKTYSESEAIEYFKTTIESEFKKNMTNDLEHIERMEAVSVTKTNSGYEITMLVKKQESIGVFQAINN